MVESKNLSSGLNIGVISVESFFDFEPSLPKFQELVYSVYTPDGSPKPITPNIDDQLYKLYSNSRKANRYFIASGNLDEMFKKPRLNGLSSLYKELGVYKNIAGFFKVEWGEFIPEQNIPIEAMVLMNNIEWPAHKVVANITSFTSNPLLPREFRCYVLSELYQQVLDIAKENGFSDNIFTILGPNVLKFVEDTGIITQPMGGKPNWDNNYASNVFNTFPKYWYNNPEIYRFLPSMQKYVWRISQ